MISQAPHSIIMVKPHTFGFNQETASSNVFQQEIKDTNVGALAIKEFDKAVKTMIKAGIKVHVFDDTEAPATPDAIFPNNWFMAQPDGKVVICPMASAARRNERRQDIIEFLKNKYAVQETIDLCIYEKDNEFLEGTGSIVFDHINKKAYACSSDRTNEKLFLSTCEKLNYKPVLFISRDENGKAIYHTNVIMSVGTGYAVVCLDAVHPADHEILLDSFAEDDLQVISISFEQMRAMAGNVLEVQTKALENVLVMSKTAVDSLLPGQLDALTRNVEIVIVEIPTIEKVGGGGIRCMMAGIHLPAK